MVWENILAKAILSMVTAAHRPHLPNAGAPGSAHSGVACLGGGALILHGQDFGMWLVNDPHSVTPFIVFNILYTPRRDVEEVTFTESLQGDISV